MLKKLLFVLALLPSFVFAQTNLSQGGTGWTSSAVGQLLVGTSSTLRYSRLDVGSAGTVLQASSTSPFRMAWVTLASIFDSLLSSNNTWTGTNTFNATTTLNKVVAGTSAGLQFFSNGLTQVADFGAGGGSNASFLGGVNVTGNLAVDTNTLYVDSANNRVGIGTTSPANKLHVYEATAATPVRLSLNNAVTGATANDGLALAVDEVGDAFVIQREAANLKLYTNNTVTNGILINSSGNVGIGTSTPNAKLHVASNSTTLVTFTTQATTSQTSAVLDVLSSTGSSLFSVLPSGRVGIASTTPTAMFTVASTSAGAEIFQMLGPNSSIFKMSGYALTYSSALSYSNSAGLSLLNTLPAGSPALTFSDASSTSRMYLKDSGASNAGSLTFDVGGFNVMKLRKGDNRQGSMVLSATSTDDTYNNASLLVRNRWDGAPAAVFAKFSNVTTSNIFEVTAENITTKYMVVNNFGNVGIGTSTPVAPLTVYSTSTSGTSPVFMVATTTPIIRAQANGRVGIGSNVGTPSAPLHIFTPVANSTTVTGQYIVNAGSGAGAGAELLLGYAATAAGSGGIASYYDTSHFGGTIGVKTRLSAGGTTFLTGSVTGDVGIGTTTPYARLAVQGQSGSSTPIFVVASSTGSTPYFQVTAAGNVGISSAAPPARLYLNQLSGGVAGGFLVGQGDSATNYAAALYRESSVNYGVLGLFDGSATARVSLRGGVGIDSFFNTGGDLGIGTSTPDSLLTVASSTQSTSYSILSIFNSLSNPIMRILGSGAVLFGTITTANCGNAPCGLTVATTTQFTAGTVARVVGYSSAASTTINLDTTDIATTTIDRATTFVNPTGTAYDGQMFEIRAKATTTQTVYWGTVFASSTDLTNVSSVASGTTRFLFEYRQDVGKWELVGKLAGYIN